MKIKKLKSIGKECLESYSSKGCSYFAEYDKRLSGPFLPFVKLKRHNKTKKKKKKE